jgi:glucose/mannose-6-phosphate isomerase
MLDDLKNMGSIDKSDMLGAISAFPQLVRSGEKAASKAKVGSLDCYNGIRFLGIGGSAIGGDFIRDWLGPSIPGGVVVERGYSFSSTLRERELVICCSYSGDTAETLGMLGQALKADPKNLLIISSGGKLGELAAKKSLAYIKLEKVPMPRASLPAVISSVTAVLDRIGTTSKASSQLRSAADSSQKFVRKEIALDVPTERNSAKQIAHMVQGFIPIAIAPSGLESIARRWKTQMNENAKQHCFFGTFPEISHNEIMPWLRDIRSEAFVALLIQDKSDGGKLEKSFAKFRALMREAVKTVDIGAYGKSRVEAMINNILLADFTSVYCAFLSGVDPTPVEEIVRFKKS